MAFWSTTYLNKIRNKIMVDVIKAKYKIGSTYYDAVINSKTVSGENVVIIVGCPNVPAGTLTITEVVLYDNNGDIVASKVESVSKTGSQGVLFKFELPIKEV